MNGFENYIERTKEQLCCNATEEFKNKYITYTYENKQIDDNLIILKNAWSLDYHRIKHYYSLMITYT